MTGGDPSSSPVPRRFPSYGSTIFEGQIFVHAAGGGLTIDAQGTFGTDSPGFYGIKLIPAPV